MCYLFTAASPRSSPQMSLVAGKTPLFSPIVNGFLALAIRFGLIKYDALRAFSFIDVGGPHKFFLSFVFCFFFLFKIPRTCLLLQGAYVSSGEADLKVVSLLH
ncbi:hypothetical protein TNIN_5231 [Trichonephila inaurata madagascariensis]|uniref:Uncharacterized protein n=1 Tax=Trichonephila inaurata madagascariensis TaxID=2747483 RepID=A0A8X6WXW0_9ARAC|nr:hypothetical protein TNIN_5231 [Trichonephila inaurata madagascariensis]